MSSLESEINEKEIILESLEEGVIAVDENLHVCTVNRVASRMLGKPKRHLLGKPLPRETSPLFEKCYSLLQASLQHGTTLTDSISTPRFYLDLIASPKAHGLGAALILQDKSNHYRALEMGKDFVANASHELRTPITIIKGFAETLQDMPELSQEMIAEITSKIVRSCQRMDTLVKNLLTLADIENLPKSRFQECDLFSLVENALHVMQSKYSTATVTFEKEEGISVLADPDLLELAIINLLDNAAKYSAAPALITVRIWQVSDEASLSISDQGIGIPTADLPNIFERFYTVNKSHSRRLGGAGLGLSIVKTIIEKHDGTITATSTLGQGTTFLLTLPT
jgi:two-component system, OmpR family, phosphate regulon sensor histidine kinase PhoR